MTTLDEAVEKAIVGVTASQGHPKTRYGIRIYPYVEIPGAKEDLAYVQSELLRFSVGSTLRPNFLRIQGIQNCSVMTRFLDSDKYAWWFKAVQMFVDRQHLTRKGIISILNLRPKVKNQNLRVKDQDIITTLMSR